MARETELLALRKADTEALERKEAELNARERLAKTTKEFTDAIDKLEGEDRACAVRRVLLLLTGCSGKLAAAGVGASQGRQAVPTGRLPQDCPAPVYQPGLAYLRWRSTPRRSRPPGLRPLRQGAIAGGRDGKPEPRVREPLNESRHPAGCFCWAGDHHLVGAEGYPGSIGASAACTAVSRRRPTARTDASRRTPNAPGRARPCAASAVGVVVEDEVHEVGGEALRWRGRWRNIRRLSHRTTPPASLMACASFSAHVRDDRRPAVADMLEAPWKRATLTHSSGSIIWRPNSVPHFA